MAVTLYEYTKAVNIPQLEKEIDASASIIVGLQSVMLSGTTALKIYMKDTLPQGEEDALDALVTAHTPVGNADEPTVFAASKTVFTTEANVLNMRRFHESTLYASLIRSSGGVDLMDVYCVTPDGIAMHVSGGVLSNSSTWTAISNFVNKPIILYDRRICTHNYIEEDTWTQQNNKKLFHGTVTNGPFVVGNTVTGTTSAAVGIVRVIGSGFVLVSVASGTFSSTEEITSGSKSATLTDIHASSLYIVKPEAGWKYILTHNVVRFPKNLGFTQANKLHFRLFLSTDNVTPVTDSSAPTIDFQYTSPYDLLRKANTYIGITNDVFDQGVGAKIAELLFHYCDKDTLKGTPIKLRYSLGEKIDAYLENDEPMMDAQDPPQALVDSECSVLMNFRRTLEF